MRFRSRHVHTTTYNFLQQTLVSKGWMGTDPINFNVSAFTLQDGWTQEPDGLEPNEHLIVFSEGDEVDDLEEELGGGLKSTDYTYFIDVAASEAWIADSVIADLKEVFSGKVLTVKDYTENSEGVDSSEQVEFTDLEINREAQFDRRAWRTLAMTATVFFT